MRLLLLAFIFTAFHSHPLLGNPTSAPRAWVYLENEKEIKKLESLAKEKGWKLTISGKFVVLEGQRTSISEKEVKALKSLPYVRSSGLDQETRQYSDKIEACRDTSTTQDLQKILLAAKNEFDCHQIKLCKDNLLPENWHEIYTDTDLMLKDLVQSQAHNNSSHVVVMDSGLDSIAKATMYATTSDSTGFDPDGHGTAVASLIASAPFPDARAVGMSYHSRLYFYEVSPSFSIALLRLKNACEQHSDPDGVVLLNLSFGYHGDETGDSPIEREYLHVLNEFREKGCLLITAAGNKKLRRSTTWDRHNDALLRVGGIDYNSRITSTNGEVYAPGVQINVAGTGATLAASEVCSDGFQLSDGSHPLPTINVNGSSFAAPIVTAIISNVQMRLKSYQSYKNLPRYEKIHLLNNIISSSITSGSVNGLKALKAAEAWGESGMTTIPNSETLSAMLEESMKNFCSRAFMSCEDVKNCTEKKSCEENFRRRVTLCPEKDNLPNLPMRIQAINQLSDDIRKGIYFGNRFENLIKSK